MVFHWWSLGHVEVHRLLDGLLIRHRHVLVVVDRVPRHLDVVPQGLLGHGVGKHTAGVQEGQLNRERQDAQVLEEHHLQLLQILLLGLTAILQIAKAPLLVLFLRLLLVLLLRLEPALLVVELQVRDRLLATRIRLHPLHVRGNAEVEGTRRDLNAVEAKVVAIPKDLHLHGLGKGLDLPIMFQMVGVGVLADEGGGEHTGSTPIGVAVGAQVGPIHIQGGRHKVLGRGALDGVEAAVKVVVHLQLLVVVLLHDEEGLADEVVPRGQLEGDLAVLQQTVAQMHLAAQERHFGWYSGVSVLYLPRG